MFNLLSEEHWQMNMKSQYQNDVIDSWRLQQNTQDLLLAIFSHQCQLVVLQLKLSDSRAYLWILADLNSAGNSISSDFQFFLSLIQALRDRSKHTSDNWYHIRVPRHSQLSGKIKVFVYPFVFLVLVWFLCLMAYQLFLGYLMPKPFS